MRAESPWEDWADGADTVPAGPPAHGPVEPTDFLERLLRAREVALRTADVLRSSGRWT